MPKAPYRIGPPKEHYPGDTVTVMDPPTSNGVATDSFGDEKGLKAPPGARGEYTERPPGNYGGPGGSIGVDPNKFDVNETNRRRRDSIPPMYLPAIASAGEPLLPPDILDAWERSHDQLNVLWDTGELADAEKLVKYMWVFYGIVKRKSGKIRSEIEQQIKRIEDYILTPVVGPREKIEKIVAMGDAAIAGIHNFAASYIGIGKDDWYTEVDYTRNGMQWLLHRLAQEIEDEDDPEDTKRWRNQHEFERGFLTPEPERPEEGSPDLQQPGIEPDLPAGQPQEERHAAPLPLDRLNNPDDAVRGQIYGVTGTLTPGLDTTQNLKHYDLTPIMQNPQVTDQMLADLGYRVETFSFDPERFKLPKLKSQGYNKDVVWIYDPEVAHGSSKDPEYTKVWRVFHEVGHGLTENFMEGKYGPSRREGRLGVMSTAMRGVPPKQIQVQIRGLTLAEAQRAVEWEDVAFRAQKMLLELYGVPISPQDFAKEYNVNIADALYRTMVGDFGDPGEYGYVASETPSDLRSMLQMLEDQERQIAQETGRQPTQGTDLRNWQPISDEEIRRALEQRMRQTTNRRAFSVYPVPRQRPQLDERLLLQIPHTAQERYNDLNRRVYDYLKNLKLNKLDLYDFPTDPPEKWVEEEKGNVQTDWQDRGAWDSFLGRLSHDDVADWIGLEVFDDERISQLAPQLHAQHALETGGQMPFAAWFRSQKPAVLDEGFLDHVKKAAESFPTEGLGKGYSGYWRRRNHEMVREVATSRARERHDRYLREVAYKEYVRPHARETFDLVEQAKRERLPLHDIIPHLGKLPVEGTDREEVDSFHQEMNDIVNEGIHSLDLYRPPVSAEDREAGNMQYMGSRLVPVSRIYGDVVVEEGQGVVSLYKYGSVYFLVDPNEKVTVPAGELLVRAHVYEIKPGSSQVKRAAVSLPEWEQKSKALAAAIREIQAGFNKEATFMKWGREYGPGLRKAVSDYLYVSRKNNTTADGSGSGIGDSTCSTFNDQTPDNCNGCTFNVGTGGYEFGYGDGACTLTHLFLNAPERGFGRGDQRMYDPTHQPGQIKKQR